MKAQHGIKAVLFMLTVYCCGLTSGAMLAPGDIVVASLGELSVDGDGAIFKVDPVTGDRTIISGPGVGSGPAFESYGVSVATIDDIYFVDGLSAIPAVYHVDVTTGNRQVIASPTTGTGPVIQSPYDIVVRNDGKLVVSDGFSGTLVLIDPVTLERSVLSGPGVGTGPDFYAPAGLSLKPGGEIFATTAITNDRATALFKVNSTSGDRELISSDDIGSGPGPDLWSDVTIDETGQPLVTNFGGVSSTPSVLAIDTTTGDRTAISSSGIGAGPAFIQPTGITIDADGKILVADIASSNGGAVVRIDSSTGNRSLVSSFEVGSGPNLQYPTFLDIVPVPEPSSIIMLGSGIVFILVLGWHRHLVARR